MEWKLGHVITVTTGIAGELYLMLELFCQLILCADVGVCILCIYLSMPPNLKFKHACFLVRNCQQNSELFSKWFPNYSIKSKSRIVSKVEIFINTEYSKGPMKVYSTKMSFVALGVSLWMTKRPCSLPTPYTATKQMLGCYLFS